MLVIHGGPGGRTRADVIEWLQEDGAHWVCWDQRGCGRSEPQGSLQHNTLDHLVADMHALLAHLGLERVGLLAGSWGAVPALEFLRRSPQRVTGLLLRAPFLGSRAEVDAFFAPWHEWLGPVGREWLGAAQVWPPGPLAGTTESATQVAIGADDSLVRAAQAWALFEDLQSQPGGVRTAGKPFTAAAAQAQPVDADLLNAYRVYQHYLRHDCFVGDADRAAWAEALQQAPGLPVSLVHGREDATCPPANAVWLASHHPRASVRLVEGAGHRSSDARLAPVLREAVRTWVRALGR